MTSESSWASRLSMRLPIVQAPMAGGIDTPALVAAVSNAGGLGFVGAAYLSPEAILAASHAVRALTDRPFGINLFAPVEPAPVGDVEAAVRRVAPYFAELGLPDPIAPTRTGESFDAQLEAVLASDASVFSFTFGLVPPNAIEAIRARGMVVVGTATTVDEAVALEASGVDAVVAQGSEAGGHRGTFLRDARTSLVGTMALVPQVVDAVNVPVIASGGIMDGRGIVAARALGAVAVQMGTAFLTCDEAGTPSAYRAAVLAARDDETRITRAFSGRAARGLVNRFMREVDTERDDDPILPFPLQNALTRPLRTAAAAQGRAEFLSAWAGQGVRLARSRSAADLMATLAREIEATETRIAR